MGGGVGHLDPQSVAQPDDAHADEIRQVGEVPLPLLERELGGLGAPAKPPQSVSQVLARDRAPSRTVDRGAIGLAQCLVDRLERPSARPRDPKRNGDDDRLCRDERNDKPIHGASIAHGSLSRRPPRPPPTIGTLAGCDCA